MSYKYNPPSGYRPEVTRSDIQDEFRRWNQQANAIVVSDWDLPMYRPGLKAAEVVFALRGQRVRVKIDQWDDFGTNLRCCYLNIRDMRLAEARGSLESLRETLAALPAPKVQRDPYELLGVHPAASMALIENAYRLAAQEAHPDKGGSNEAMAEVNAAIDRIRQERGVR